MARGASGSVAAVTAATDGRPGTTNVFGGKRLGNARNMASPTGMSVADQNFGLTTQSILPNVGENNVSIQNAKSSEPFSASGSFLDAKSQSGAGGQPLINTTSDILFLKRLLFLKAALDND